MATAPDRVRHGLALITRAAQAEIQAVARAAQGHGVTELRAALFAAAPLVVDHYSDGAAALALDWYEQIRDEASPPHAYTPTPLRSVTPDDVAAMVAATTSTLYAVEQGEDIPVPKAVQSSLDLVEGGIQKQVADGFWTTATKNTALDPDAVGWARYASGAGCKFCQMLAGRGAVYSESTVHFAAHNHCHCVAGPSYDPKAPRASVEQYVASQRTRTVKERANLREYLNHNFPHAPG